MTNSFNQLATQRNFCACFFTQYLRFWEQWLKEIFPCQPWELTEINVLFKVITGESPASHR